MKKILSFFLLLCAATALSAQVVTTTLTFTGAHEDGQYVQLDSVSVNNVSKTWTETLVYPDTVLSIQNVGIQDLNLAYWGKNYPNPFNGRTDVEINLPKSGDMSLRVVDITGKLHAQYDATLEAGAYRFAVTLATPQTYLLSIVTSYGTKTIKMMNVGNAGSDKIEFTSAQKHSSQLKSTLSETVKPFDNGDLMRYIGYAANYDNVTIEKNQEGSENITFIFPKPEEKDTLNGRLPKTFTVASNHKVYFSQGNLQFSPLDEIFRFAEQQYDIIGGDNINIKDDYEGWIDLIGWGTSGYNDKYPYMYIGTHVSYGDSLNDIRGTEYDWGVHDAITNGGNKAGLWRTLSLSEWNYLIHLRKDAEQKYALATVADITGAIILPDEWQLPAGITFKAGTDSTGYRINQYDAAQWEKMQTAGALFLPAAGSRYMLKMSNTVGAEGCYWSSSCADTNKIDMDEGAEAFLLNISKKNVDVARGLRAMGYSVRLVQDCGELPAPVLPTVVSDSINHILFGSAQGYGHVVEDGGAKVTRFGYCWNTEPNPTIENNCSYDGIEISPFESKITGLKSETKYYARAYATNSAGTAYGEEFNFTTEKKKVVDDDQEGMLKGKFSVSSSTQISFSKGNLQYQASKNIWRFAENQYDTLGIRNQKISETNEDWIDLFGWATSGYNHVDPFSTATPHTSYGPLDEDITNTQYDWGVHNAISNGGNKAGVWRTLTGAEWAYLINGRENASQKYAQANITVNNISYNGLILLPDEWTTPEGISLKVGNVKSYTKYNNYTAEQWKKLEDAGAVFLPRDGYRTESSFKSSDNNCYWSSTVDPTDNTKAVRLNFAYSRVIVLLDGGSSKCQGNCVRLVVNR